MSDYYQMLGVASTASASEIRQAYARIAREKHPDRITDPARKQDAEKAFQETTEAFNTLMHPDRRAKYDQERLRPQPRTPEEIAGDAFGRAPSLARDAVQALEKATQLEPRNAVAFADLAAVLARQGLRLRAQKAMETALRLAPRDPKIARLAAELGLGQP